MTFRVGESATTRTWAGPEERVGVVSNMMMHDQTGRDIATFLAGTDPTPRQGGPVGTGGPTDEVPIRFAPGTRGAPAGGRREGPLALDNVPFSI